MSEFDKLPMEQIDCEFYSMFFYYLADYVAHKDLKHSFILGDKRIRRNPQPKANLCCDPFNVINVS